MKTRDGTYPLAWQNEWLRYFYTDRADWTDGTTQFHELCREVVPPRGKILEVGAGPSNRTSQYLSSLGELHGVDVDDEVFGNESLSKASVLVADKIPYPDDTFDAAVSNYVVEHVRDAVSHLLEIRRVLKPGAPYVFRTPNLWHYVALFSRLTPHVIHRAFANRLRAVGPNHHEPWPTRYALNTARKVDQYAGQAGFRVRSIQMVEKEPSYGMYARPLFLAFMIYERVVNASPALAGMRANLFAVLEKRS